MLDQKIGHAVHRKRTHLPDIGSIVQHTRSNRLIELKRLINKLDRSNKHKLRLAGSLHRSNQLQKIRSFSNDDNPEDEVVCTQQYNEIVRILTSRL